MIYLTVNRWSARAGAGAAHRSARAAWCSWCALACCGVTRWTPQDVVVCQFHEQRLAHSVPFHKRALRDRKLLWHKGLAGGAIGMLDRGRGPMCCPEVFIFPTRWSYMVYRKVDGERWKLRSERGIGVDAEAWIGCLRVVSC